MKRKALSLILAFAMAVSLFTVGASAAEPTYGDTAGHWAEASIERWSGYGIIQGSNGKFDPDGQLTCAQLATILARLLKLPAAKDAGFIDNPADAWYYDAINRCAAAGILKGNGDGTVTPNASITRERAMVMLGRALGIEPIENPDLTQFTDGAQVASYARGMLAALIRAGIVGGVTADQLAPQNNITRAATVTILDRAIGTYADKAGETVNANGKGIVLVVADDVTVSGTIGCLLIPTDNIVVTVSGSKNIGSIAITGNHSTVILDNATADDVTISGVDSKVETKNGSHIKNIALTESASGAVVAAGSGTTIDNVANSAPGAAVTGSGTVKSVASDTDVTVETKNTEVKNTGRSEITVTDAKGKETTVKPGTSTTVNKESASSSGSSGGSYTPPAQHTHTWNDGVVTTPATCTESGVKTYTCTVCGETKTEAIAALGHVWGAYTVTKHAVNGNDGEKTRTCSRCNITERAPLLYKFYLGIESGSTVDMTVGEDYTAVFTMPAAGGTVNTGSIDLTAKMQKVASLGVEGVKSHATTISTGLGGTEVALDAWLPHCYSFEGATIDATIDGKSCTYTLRGIDKITDSSMYTITAATDPAAASAAWQALTSHVNAGTQADDSKIVIKNGAYLMIGTEKLEFTSSEVGDLTLDNFNNMNALNETIRNHVKLSPCDDQGGKITMYLPAGTQLAVGGSVATLEKNCTVTITLDADEMGSLSTALSTLENEKDATMMVKELVQQFDNLIGAIDATGNVTVNVSFT